MNETSKEIKKGDILLDDSSEEDREYEKVLAVDSVNEIALLDFYSTNFERTDRYRADRRWKTFEEIDNRYIIGQIPPLEKPKPKPEGKYKRIFGKIYKLIED